MVNADVYNAFAVPAGHIFINSGLMAAMETEDELAGILGHEIAHVVARHISDRIARSKKISIATLAGVVAGLFLGVGGATDAAQAVTQGAMAAGQSASLAFSRDDERQADQLGLNYLAQAGYSGWGLLSVMKKLRSKQWYDTTLFPDYLSTHPGSEERMATIGSWLQQNSGKPVAAPPRKTYEFSQVRARLIAVYGDENTALRQFVAEVEKDPDDPLGHYGYGLALVRKGNFDGAAVELRKALEKKVFDPYILNDLGRVYFLNGQYEQAIVSLEGTVSIKPENREALFLLGQTQMELGNLRAAQTAIEDLVLLDPDYPQASYYLGSIYGKQGQLGLAHYYLGKHYREEGDMKNAIFHLQRAQTLVSDPATREKITALIAEVNEEKKKGKKTG